MPLTTLSAKIFAMRTPCGALVFCGLLTLLCVSGAAKAQPVSENTASQRILPLPENKLADFQTQLQLLQRLRSLVAATEDSQKPEKPSPDDASTIDDTQLEQLQQALKKLREQLPPGIKPPDLESIPKEQLDEAISNPAVQQQLKKMLEQFSKDGLLPKNDNGTGNSQFPPIPRRPGQPSLQAFQDLLERYKNSQRNQPPNDATNAPKPDDTRLPEVRPGMSSPRTGNDESAAAPDSSKRVIRRPDSSTDVEPPIKAGPETSAQGEVFPPDERLSHHLLPSVSEFLKEQLRKGVLAPGADASMQSPKSPAANGSRDASRHGNPNQSKSPPSSMPNEGTGTEQSGVDIRNELEKRGIRGTLEKLIEKAEEESKTQQKTQQDAVAGQLGKDVRLPENTGSQNTGSQNTQPKTPDDAGLQKSLIDLLGGLDDNLQNIVNDAKFQDRSADSRRSRDSARHQSSTDSDSHLNKWNDAASDFLADLSTAPQAPTSPRSPTGDGSSIPTNDPLAIGSFFLVGLGLLGLVAVIAVLMRRRLLKLVSDASGIAGPRYALKPSEICTREDVIVAFHELALNPKQLVESWWTHRAAARKLAAASPQQENAVQTLAEIYEQARYLPDYVEIPDDRIQSARTALAECQ